MNHRLKLNSIFEKAFSRKLGIKELSIENQIRLKGRKDYSSITSIWVTLVYPSFEKPGELLVVGHQTGYEVLFASTENYSARISLPATWVDPLTQLFESINIFSKEYSSIVDGYAYTIQLKRFSGLVKDLEIYLDC